MEDELRDQWLTLKNNQVVGRALAKPNSQTKLTKEEYLHMARTMILIMSQFQADQLHQQHQLFKNYLTRFQDYKMSVIEQRWERKQKETRTQL